jgi:hypothetical protein
MQEIDCSCKDYRNRLAVTTDSLSSSSDWHSSSSHLRDLSRPGGHSAGAVGCHQSRWLAMTENCLIENRSRGDLLSGIAGIGLAAQVRMS